MILLDTNVVSEPLRPQPENRVADWLDKQVVETLYLSAITVAELRLGVAQLPNGRKKETLHKQLEQVVLPLFAERILPFDDATAASYATIRAGARAKGKAIAAADGYIAATARQHGFIVATRDAAPFLAADLKVINPWDAD